MYILAPVVGALIGGGIYRLVAGHMLPPVDEGESEDAGNSR